MTRYYSHIRAGSTELGAAILTADSYGIPVVQLTSAGRSQSIDWTLPEIERLLFLQFRVETGRIGWG